MKKFRVVHYINQFFGQIGGEEKADIPPLDKEGPVGPGMAFNAAFSGEAEIVGTVICGDSYFNENLEQALKDVLERIKKYEPDLVIAGPAFNAGRYGMACGRLCKAVKETLNIPAVTGMFMENPGVEVYKKDVYIVETAGSAAGMREAVPKMAKLALKLAKGEEIGLPREEGYIPRGIRKNVFVKENGAIRAVDMLVKKLKGEPFVTEYPMPDFDRVTPAPAIKDLKSAKIALVTSGGIVPKGNPDRIEASSASRFGKYDIEGVDFLTPETFQTAHGGYDPTYANQDPNRVLPVDVMRELEREGVIGKLHRYYYATVGNGTSVGNAKKFAQEIAKELVADGVQAVILTST
ncbi:Glycine reductase complex component B subunit gamma [Thermovenabulum gondwanense]|uniref:Glycine reductase complex component B subunit gamma n=3 Tax=Thermovenabulum gondwanense TaxID=520767 RepID=A0A161Q1Y1_9FIRM|nr:Glycine reductase complex component B subunit gamma [Thermovenabulum gondwanense]